MVGVAAQEYIFHQYIAEISDAELEEVLYLTIALPLASQGFSSTREKQSTAYLLIVSYSKSDTRLDLTLSLKSNNRPAPIEWKKKGIVDMDRSFEAGIETLTHALLESAGLEGRRNLPGFREGIIDGLLSAKPTAKEAERRAPSEPGYPPATESKPESARDKEPVVSQETIDKEGPIAPRDGAQPDQAAPAKLPREETANRITAPVRETPLHLLIASGIEAPIFFGDLSQYVQLGALSSLSSGLRMKRGVWNLDIKARFAGLRAFNRDGISGGPLWMMNTGLDLSIGMSPFQQLRMEALLTGGASFIGIETGTVSVWKTVPQLETGAALFWTPGKGFEIGMELRYMWVFDHDILIHALSPGIRLLKEF